MHLKIRLQLTLVVPLCMILWSLVSVEAGAQSYQRNDSIRIYALLDTSDNETMNGSWANAIGYAEKALQQSQRSKMLRGEGFSKLKLADIFLIQENITQCNDLIKDGLNIGVRLKDTFMIALANYQQGKIALYEGNTDVAEKLFNKSLELYFGKNESYYTALVYNDMGVLFGQNDEVELQIDWLYKAMRIYERQEDMNGLAVTMNNLATAFGNLGNIPKAVEFVRSSIVLREKLQDVKGLASSYENLSRLLRPTSIDSAIKYQQVAMRYAERLGVKGLMIRSYDNLSVLSDMQRNKPQALAYIRKSIVLAREMNDLPGIAAKARWAGLLCGDMKDTVAMENYYRECYDISVQLKNKSLLRDLYGTKASYFNSVKDYRNAYDNLKKYYAYRDSIVTSETETNIAELQTKYDTETKDNEIRRLNTGQQIKQLEIEKQNALIAGNTLVAKQKENEITLLSQQQQLRDIRIRQQGEELEKQLLISKNNQQQLKLAATEKDLQQRQLNNQRQLRNFMIAGMLLLAILGYVLFNRYLLKKKLQQQNALLAVRGNIAKDLHDEIGSTLTSIKILSQVSHNNLQKDRDKASSMLEKITEQSTQMQQGMSDIVWAIAPQNDKLENMVVRMREYISQTLEPKNIAATLDIEEKMLAKSFDMQQRRDFFLIFKEAVNNAAKYSGAKNVSITVTGDTKKISLHIADDGVGFDTGKIVSSSGVKNMRARAIALHGSFSIESGAGKGTRIFVEVPAT